MYRFYDRPYFQRNTEERNGKKTYFFQKIHISCHGNHKILPIIMAIHRSVEKGSIHNLQKSDFE